MATISAAIITLLVIIGFSLPAESFPVLKGCTKMVGVLEKGIPGEYVVKMSSGVKPHTIVQMMLEMTTSDCQRRAYRTSNAPDAPMKSITCSKMIYIDGFGFAAKMSDAAIMWVSELG